MDGYFLCFFGSKEGEKPLWTGLVRFSPVCVEKIIFASCRGEAREYALERLKKYCSHSVRPLGSGLFGFWLRFRSVWLPKPCESGAQSRRALRAKQSGRYGHAPSLKRGLPTPCQSVSHIKDVPLRGKECQKPKILAPRGYSIFEKALTGRRVIPHRESSAHRVKLQQKVKRIEAE